MEDQDKSITRARGRAADLAHGLKTPLTVLNTVARQIEAGAVKGAANDIREQTGLMDRHVQRQLAMTRLAPERRRKTTQVRTIAERIAGSMQRLPDGATVRWTLAIPESATISADSDDLVELIGNLADNARLWAKGAASIRLEPRDGGMSLLVEDDGPGVPSELREVVIKRGKRLDPSRPGNGLGLAIVADICEAYGWQLTLGESDLGGLRAEVSIPTREQWKEAAE